MRLVMDTNVIVAALRSDAGASRLWLESILDGAHLLLLSVPLVLEYEDVLKRPEIKKATGWSVSETSEFLDTLCALAEPVELHYRLRPMLRDPDDEFVLETAVVGRADVLLTFNERDFASAACVGVRVAQPGLEWLQTKRS